MKIGMVLPQIGKASGAQLIVDIAQGAETVGLNSLWVTDRLLWPCGPQTPYPGSGDGLLPREYQRVFDPLSVLAFVAGSTKRIRLGTCVLNVPFYKPSLLARQLTTIDQLSEGRLDIGLGLGWSMDEFIAAGAYPTDRGRQCEEFVDALRTIWTSDIVQFAGLWTSIPPSIIDLKPVQRPHPPIFLASSVETGVARAAKIADGWISIGLPLPQLTAMLSTLQAHVEAVGRDRNHVQSIVRLPVTLTEYVPTSASERSLGVGCLEQILEDLYALATIGVDEVIIDPTFSETGQSVDGWLCMLEQARIIVERSTPDYKTTETSRS